MRLDRYLSSQVSLSKSRAQIQRLILEGHCSLNGGPARAAAQLVVGQTVELYVPPPAAETLAPESISLDILYEDADLIVVNKPAGMVVHPGPGNRTGTLVSALLAHCDSLSGIGGRQRPGIVHRLDKQTTGVMLATKTDQAHHCLSEQFAEHTVERSYLAIVSGGLEAERGTFDTLHGRHPAHRKRFSSRVTRGRRAVTHYRVLRRFSMATEVEARLATGRTHQVRVHFADAGHPLLGDSVYGRAPRDPELRLAARELGRQALHARVLAFTHPGGQRMRFEAPLPADIHRLLDTLSPA